MVSGFYNLNLGNKKKGERSLGSAAVIFFTKEAACEGEVEWVQRNYWEGRNACAIILFGRTPSWFEFWSFLTFLHHGIEKVERHLLWKFHKKILRKSWSNVPPKLLAFLRFLYKVVHKIGSLRKFSRALKIEFNFFLSFGLSLWNLAHLFIMFMATKHCLRFLIFA